MSIGGSEIDLPTIPKKSPVDILKNMGVSFVNSAANAAVAALFSHVNGNKPSGPPDTSNILYNVRRAPNLIEKDIFSPFKNGYQNANTILSTAMVKRVNAGSDGAITNRAPGNDWLIADPRIYTLMNTYRYNFGSDVNIFVPSDVTLEQDGTKKSLTTIFNGQTLAPSLFNPYYAVQVIGPTANTPLSDVSLNGKEGTKEPSDKGGGGGGPKGEVLRDFTDCSITRLCALSTVADGSNILGQARYKYSDFMYCKDLGMPNNRMITLRRFSMPVGDNIFGSAALYGDDDKDRYSTPGDVGRMICYFDTEDNKLEDILNYSFGATWVEKESEWQQDFSKEDNRNSPLGMILNTADASYRQSIVDSTSGGNNLFSHFLGKTTLLGNDAGSWYKDNETLKNYDKNKIYDPVDTIRKMAMYEGKLEFNHEFTLTFNYVLRAYDNINPKAAMLDLLSNITATTYKRGYFWGGRQQIVGAQPNTAGWKAAQKLIDGTFADLGGIFSTMFDNGFDFSGMFGSLASQVQKLQNDFIEGAKAMVGMSKAPDVGVSQGGENETAENSNTGSNGIIETGKKVVKEGGKAFAAHLKNMLGRPQLYAFNSLLTGDNTGLWHVTIGNPLNPIAVMGNMIVKDVKLQHYGPLGIDDFPTGIKVQVTLAHARPRDMVDIQKMYTQGNSAIYVPIVARKQKAGGGGEDHPHIVNNTSSQGTVMYFGDNNAQRIKRNIDELK